MIVSVSELTTYMDISLSLRQQDAAEFVLAGLQSELETYLRRPIEVSEFTETHVLPSSSKEFQLHHFFMMNHWIQVASQSITFSHLLLFR